MELFGKADGIRESCKFLSNKSDLDVNAQTTRRTNYCRIVIYFVELLKKKKVFNNKLIIVF